MYVTARLRTSGGDTIVFSDIALRPETAKPLATVAAWLLSPDFLEEMKWDTTVSVAIGTESAREAAAHRLTDLAAAASRPGVQWSGAVQSLDAEGIWVTEKTVVVRFVIGAYVGLALT